MEKKIRYSILMGLLLVGLVILKVGIALAQTLTGPEIIKRIQEAEGKIDFVGTEVTNIYFLRGVESAIVKVTCRSPYKIRKEFQSPPEAAGRLIVDDGERELFYFPRHRRLLTQESPRSSHRRELSRQRLNLLLNNYEIKILGKELVSGRKASVVSITPKFRGNPSLKIWVDSEYWLILKRERYNAQGHLIFSTAYTVLDFSQKVPDEEFTLKVPPDVKVIKTSALGEKPLTIEEARPKVNFQILLPKYIPPGYVFEGIYLLPPEGKRGLHLKYSDGLNVISLFERPQANLIMHVIPSFLKSLAKRLFERPQANLIMPGYRMRGFGPRMGRFCEDRPEKIFAWDAEGVSLILMGDLTEEEIGKIVQSLDRKEILR